MNNLPSVNDYKRYFQNQATYEGQLQVLGEKINEITAKMAPIQKVLTEARSVSYLYKDEFPIRQWNISGNIFRFTLMGQLDGKSDNYRWIEISLKTDGTFAFYFSAYELSRKENTITSNIKDLGEAKKAALELLTTGEYCVTVLSVPQFKQQIPY